MRSSLQMPKGTDDTWGEKLYAKCSKSIHFAKPRFGKFDLCILDCTFRSS